MNAIEWIKSNYRIKEFIGEGSYVKVYRGKNRKISKSVAIKSLDKGIIDSSTSHFINDLKIIKQLHSPFIAEMYQVIEDKENTFVITELANEGNLLSFLEKKGKLQESEAKKFFVQILSAIYYLHKEKHIAHRDIKLENILLNNGTIKLIDFGFSKSFKNGNGFNSSIGSAAYVSPEIAKGEIYSEKADIWSLGVILYIMTTGSLPFCGTSVRTQLQRIAFVEPIYPSFLSLDLQDLLKRLLTKDPNSRITLDEIFEHNWLKEFKNFYESTFRIYNNLISSLDKHIINYMKCLSIDCSILYSNNWNDIVNDDTVTIYKILIHSKISRCISSKINLIEQKLFDKCFFRNNRKEFRNQNDLNDEIVL